MLAVFDIDGVVANVDHRLHHLDGHKSWDAFFQAAADDTLLPAGAQLAADLATTYELVWLTGRPDWLRELTARWLHAHELPGTELHMRHAGDYRPGPVYKMSVLGTLRERGIAALIDDDPLVIDAALAAGYPAQLADWAPRDRRLRLAQDEHGRT